MATRAEANAIAGIKAHTEKNFEALRADNAKNFDSLKSDFLQSMTAAIRTAVTEAVKDSVAELKSEVDELKNTVGVLASENDFLKDTVKDMRTEIDALTAKVDNTDRGLVGLSNEEKAITSNLKATNLVLYGVAEYDNENVASVVKKTLAEEFGVEGVENIIFRDLFRMGKVDPKHPRTKPRPVKIQMITMADKRKLMGAYLSKRKAFLDKGFRMRDDLPQKTRVFRAEAYKYFERIMSVGHTPSFRDNCVRIDLGNHVVRTFYKVDDLVAFVNNMPDAPEA